MDRNSAKCCPICREAPVVTNEPAWTYLNISLPAACEIRCHHGFVARGENLEQAILHWNILIASFFAHSSYVAAPVEASKKLDTYCLHCQTYTPTKVYEEPERRYAQCGSCHLMKHEHYRTP